MANCIIKSVFAIVISVMLFTSCNNNPTQNKSNEKGKINIAAILPLTGNAAVAGEYSKNGLQLAVEEINASGGINGSLIDISYNDSKGDAKEGVNLIMKVNTGNKPSIIYSQLSGVSLAIKPITEKNNQILIAVSGAGNLLDSSNHTYRNYIDPNTFTNIVTKNLKDTFQIQRIGILYANSEFGRSIFNSLSKNMKSQNIELSFESQFDEQSNDYKTVVEKLKQSKVENVYVIGIGKSLGLVYKTLKEYKYNGRIFGGIESTLPDAKNAVGDLGKGITYFDFAYSAEYNFPGYKSFVEKYKAKFNSEPAIPVVLAYSAMMSLSKNMSTFSDGGANAKTEGNEFPFVQVENKNFTHPIKIKTY